jgi:hypothetical protein
MVEEGAPTGKAFHQATIGTVRSFDEEMGFIEQLSPCKFRISPGFVPNMNVPGRYSEFKY